MGSKYFWLISNLKKIFMKKKKERICGGWGLFFEWDFFLQQMPKFGSWEDDAVWFCCLFFLLQINTLSKKKTTHTRNKANGHS